MHFKIFIWYFIYVYLQFIEHHLVILAALYLNRTLFFNYYFSSIQFISHSTDPVQGHQEHMDMDIFR
jgi:hypothetical protein